MKEDSYYEFWEVAVRYKGDIFGRCGISFDHRPTKKEISDAIKNILHSLPSVAEKEYNIYNTKTKTITTTKEGEWKPI